MFVHEKQNNRISVSVRDSKLLIKSLNEKSILRNLKYIKKLKIIISVPFAKLWIKI